MTTKASCTGSNPYGDLLSHSKDLSDSVTQGSAAKDKGKTPLEAAADQLAKGVFDVANAALRETVLGPSGIAVGPLLEGADDIIQKKITIPVKKLNEEARWKQDHTTAFAQAFVNGFCEDTYSQPDVGGSSITEANARLAESVLQGLRNCLSFFARPAEVASKGFKTDVSVDMIVSTIETIPQATQKGLGLDTFAADLRSKVNGDPKAFLSVLFQGVASITGHAACKNPGVNDLKNRISTAANGDSKPLAAWCLQKLQAFDTLANCDDRLFEQVLVDAFKSAREASEANRKKYANPPEGQVHDGVKVNSTTHDHSASQDVFSPVDVPDADLVSPTKSSDTAAGTPSLLAKNPDVAPKKNPSASFLPSEEQPSLPTDGDKPAFIDFLKVEASIKEVLDEIRNKPPILVDRPPDFKTFTGEFSATIMDGPTRQQELRDLAQLGAYYKKNGWPEKRFVYELNCRLKKIGHREEKLAHVDVDVKLKNQTDRVKEAFQKLKTAEARHAKTNKHGHIVSKAAVDYLAEQKYLKWLSLISKPVSKDTLTKSSVPLPKVKNSEKSLDSVSGAAPLLVKEPLKEQIGSIELPVILLRDYAVKALEAEIQAIDVKIEMFSKKVKLADKRVKRYKKTWRKICQKGLFFCARKPEVVVAEETILSTLNQEQKIKFIEKKADLLKKLEQVKNLPLEAAALHPMTRKIEELSIKDSDLSLNPVSEAPLESCPEKIEDLPSEEEKKDALESAELSPSQKDPLSDSPAESKLDAVLSGAKILLDKALSPAKKLQKKAVEAAEKIEKKAEETIRAGHEKVFEGKKHLAEADRLQKIADLIDKKLAEGEKKVTLKTKDGKEKSITKEQAQKLKAEALEKGLAKKKMAAAGIIEGAAQATQGSGVNLGARRLKKELGKAYSSSANTLGSNVGGTAVDFCFQGDFSKDAAKKAAYGVASQTVRGVGSQLLQTVTRSTIKGVVKEIAPAIAKKIPGLPVINTVYTLGSATLSSKSVGEAAGNFVSAGTDMAISYGCTVAFQACIPIPFVGACVGAAAGSLAIHAKNGLVSWYRS